MDIATVLGIVAGIVNILVGILLGGSLMLFINVQSIVITVVGSMVSVVINYKLQDVLGLSNVLMKAVIVRQEDPSEVIALLVKFAERARREGILALEKQMEEVEDEFLRNGIQLAVDGTEPELLKDIMETELAYIESRHKKGRGIFEQWGYFAPAWGMIGTLIGLINMLANLDNPDALGPGMAVALITTLYGSVLANFLLLPIAGKLKEYSGEELLIKEMMIQGILSIQSGDNPRIVEQKLNSFIAPKDRKFKGE